ncbi:helix-turn-helix domain-containing protein [Candidatus Woesearchaeota archaeon]|nr:helix-turn-helix domain-containing protein [Candidatus Woesearchaeota archaeon]
MNKQRLNSTELDQISTLILSGFSLKTIANKLNKSKTTIYYHFRKVKGKTIIPLTINRLNDELIGEFIGLFAGDGSFYKTKDYKYKIRLHFSCRDQNYVDNLIKNVLVPLFNKKPMQFLEENRLNLCYNSKELYGFIKQYLLWDHHLKKTYTVRLISNNYSKKFLIGFIRGSLDSDGHFSSDKISFATVSTNLKDNIISALKILDLTYSVGYYVDKRPNRVGIYHINIPKGEHPKFISLIKPRNMRS